MSSSDSSGSPVTVETSLVTSGRDTSAQKGFVNPHITLKRSINSKNHTLDLIFNIQIGKRKIVKFQGNSLFSEKKIKDDIIGSNQPEWLFSPDIISEQLKGAGYSIAAGRGDYQNGKK